MDKDAVDKVEQIQNLLNNEETAGKVKDIINALTANMGDSKSTSNDNPGTDILKNLPEDFLSGNKSNIESMMKIKGILDVLNDSNDSGVNLINALKPFLSNTRKTKAAKCINLLQVSKLTKMMKNKNGLEDLFNGRQ